MRKDLCILNFMTLQSWLMTYHADCHFHTHVNISCRCCEICVHYKPNDLYEKKLRYGIDRIRMPETEIEVRDIEGHSARVISVAWEWR